MDEISQWLLLLYLEHLFSASLLGLTNPVRTLKTDLRQKVKGPKRKNKLHHLENQKALYVYHSKLNELRGYKHLTFTRTITMKIINPLKTKRGK